MLLAFLPSISLEWVDLRRSSGCGVNLIKYSSSAMPSSSYELLKSWFGCTAEEAMLERIWDLFDARFNGFPDSHDASESTDARDCDMILPTGAPGLTGESERMPN